jgi:hypothetical protein
MPEAAANTGHRLRVVSCGDPYLHPRRFDFSRFRWGAHVLDHLDAPPRGEADITTWQRGAVGLTVLPRIAESGSNVRR